MYMYQNIPSRHSRITTTTLYFEEMPLYHLPQMVQCLIGQEWEILPPRKLHFATVNGQRQASIEIQFERQLVDSGWILSLESNNKVFQLYMPSKEHSILASIVIVTHFWGWE